MQNSLPLNQRQNCRQNVFFFLTESNIFFSPKKDKSQTCIFRHTMPIQADEKNRFSDYHLKNFQSFSLFICRCISLLDALQKTHFSILLITMKNYLHGFFSVWCDFLLLLLLTLDSSVGRSHCCSWKGDLSFALRYILVFKEP